MVNLDPTLQAIIDAGIDLTEDEVPDTDPVEPTEPTEPEPEPENNDEPVQEPDRVAELQAQIDTLRSERAHIEDLKRSIGRMQAIEQRLQQTEASEAEKREALVSEIEQNFGGVTQLLEDIVTGMDETSIDPATRARAQAALNDRKRAAELASLRKSVAAELQQAQTPVEPAPLEQPQTVSGFTEQQLADYDAMVDDKLRSAGMDPDKFDWAEASQSLKSGGLPSLLAHVQTKIDQNADANRRQAAKVSAGGGSAQASAPADDSSRIIYKDLDDGIEKLRQLGLNV